MGSFFVLGSDSAVLRVRTLVRFTTCVVLCLLSLSLGVICLRIIPDYPFSLSLSLALDEEK